MGIAKRMPLFLAGKPEKTYFMSPRIYFMSPRVSSTLIFFLLKFTFTAGYTFFASVHGTFPRIDHALGHKKGLSKLKKIEFLPTNSSDDKV